MKTNKKKTKISLEGISKKLEKFYLKKDENEEGTVYELLNVTNGYFILKKENAYNEETEIFVVDQKKFKEEYYKAEELIIHGEFVNAYGKYQREITESIIMESEVLLLLYKDQYNEIIYSEQLHSPVVIPSTFTIEEFVPYKKNKEVEVISPKDIRSIKHPKKVRKQEK